MLFRDYGLKLYWKEIVNLLDQEDTYQIVKWGFQTHSQFEWLAYVTEELGELSKAISEHNYRNGSEEDVVSEAIQAATLAIKIALMYRHPDREI